MRDPVFSLIGIRGDYLADMLGFGIMGVDTAAEGNVNMPSHRLANHIAQHRATLVV